MTVSFQVTFDAADPDRLAHFWAAALGYQLQPPPQGFETWEDFLRANDLFLDANNASAIVDPAGIAPRIYFQRVPESKSAKNRVHVDINVVGRRDVSREERLRLLVEEADRLVELGASKTEAYDEPGELWIVMRDPEGNEFCLQ